MSQSSSRDSSSPKKAHELSHHVLPIKVYLFIFVGLISLTALTVALSYTHLGRLNLAIAIVIASMKAALVLLFFMHLKYDNKFYGAILLSGLMFIGVFFALTMNDTGHRSNELNDVDGEKVYLGGSDPQAPGGFEPPEKKLSEQKEGSESRKTK